MPFALLFIGLLLLVSGVQNTYKQLGEQVTKDFTGDGNFFYWVISLGIVGSIGYIKEYKKVSDAGLILLLVVFVFAASNKKNVFSMLTSGLKEGTSTPTLPIGQELPASGGGSGGGGGGGGDDFLSTAISVGLGFL